MSGWESPRSELPQSMQVVLLVVIAIVLLFGVWRLMQPSGGEMDPNLDQHSLDHWR